MKEVSVTFWEVTPEEAIKLPKGTQLIEYCRFSGRLAIKRSDHCLYDYSCVYLLAKEPQTVQKGEPAKGQKGNMKKGFAITMGAFATVFAVLIGAGLSGCKTETDDKQAGASVDAVGGGMVLDVPVAPEEPEEGTITFSKQAIPFSEYEENGISPQAESAYTITATVSPDNEAVNTEIVWSASFQNGAWIENNSYQYLTDYFTYSYGSSVSGSKTVTVSCLKCFGKPIILTAYCKYQPSIRATVQIDYAPKIISITRDYYGQLTGLNAEQKKTVHVSKFNINTGVSGIPQFSGLYGVSISQYYTLEDTFKVTVDVRNGQPFNTVGSTYVCAQDCMITSTTLSVTSSDMETGYIYGVNLSFDMRVNGVSTRWLIFNASMFDRMNICYCTPTYNRITSSTALATRQKYLSVNQNASNAMLSNVTLCDLKFSFTGTHTSTEFWATLIVDQFVNET